MEDKTKDNAALFLGGVSASAAAASTGLFSNATLAAIAGAAGAHGAAGAGTTLISILGLTNPLGLGILAGACGISALGFYLSKKS